jgi:hypothetical protein
MMTPLLTRQVHLVFVRIWTGAFAARFSVLFFTVPCIPLFSLEIQNSRYPNPVRVPAPSSS